MHRREFVAGSMGTLLAGLAPAGTNAATQDVTDLPSQWDVDRSIANLENAYWGVMPKVVNDEYLEQTRFLNQRNVVYVRDGIAGRERTAEMEKVRADVASGCRQ